MADTLDASIGEEARPHAQRASQTAIPHLPVVENYTSRLMESARTNKEEHKGLKRGFKKYVEHLISEKGVRPEDIEAQYRQASRCSVEIIPDGSAVIRNRQGKDTSGYQRGVLSVKLPSARVVNLFTDSRPKVLECIAQMLMELFFVQIWNLRH